MKLRRPLSVIEQGLLARCRKGPVQTTTKWRPCKRLVDLKLICRNKFGLYVATKPLDT